jgi:hypothetical protein
MPSDLLPNHPEPRQIPRLQVEDTLVRVGPLALSLRQAAVLLVGGRVAWNLWKITAFLAAWHTLGALLRVFLVTLPALVSLAFAFGKYFGRRYDIWITVIWRYLWLSKVAIWRQHAVSCLTTEEDTPSLRSGESEAR